MLKEGAERSEAGDLTLIAVRRTIEFASVRELYRSFVKAQITEERLNRLRRAIKDKSPLPLNKDAIYKA